MGSPTQRGGVSPPHDGPWRRGTALALLVALAALAADAALSATSSIALRPTWWREERILLAATIALAALVLVTATSRRDAAADREATLVRCACLRNAGKAHRAGCRGASR